MSSPEKPKTDVVVMGSAWSRARRFIEEVQKMRVKSQSGSLSQSNQTSHSWNTASAALLVAITGAAAGCGPGGHRTLTTDMASPCDEWACLLPRPNSPSFTCADGSVAGPACVKLDAGGCGWAVLSCPVQRGGTDAGRGATGGTGGFVPSTGGFFGGEFGSGGASSGGHVGSGGVSGHEGTGGYIGSGGLGASGGTFGTGATQGSKDGSFQYVGYGVTQSGYGYYEENLALNNKSFLINIANQWDFSGGIPCHLTGQFPAVPPPPGSYPITDVAGPQVDGTFAGICAVTWSEFSRADQSIGGTVTLTKSEPGNVQGSFSMQVRQIEGGGTGGVAGTPSYTGSFSVGCRDDRPLTDPACAARSFTP